MASPNSDTNVLHHCKSTGLKCHPVQLFTASLHTKLTILTVSGLKINTSDYNYIYNKFWSGEEGYDIENYDGEAIWKDHTMPHFRDSYDHTMPHF